MDTPWTPWVKQADGTYLPHPDLMKAVRENPGNFPNFIEDAAALTGKTRAQVTAIIYNPYGDGGLFSGRIVGPVAKTVLFPDVRRGLTEAAGWAAKKLLPDPGIGDAIHDYGQTINAEFENERDLGEHLAEVAGQAAPSVAAAAATGGGYIVPAVVGAGVSTLTFDDEDNSANVLMDMYENLKREPEADPR